MIDASHSSGNRETALKQPAAGSITHDRHVKDLCKDAEEVSAKHRTVIATHDAATSLPSSSGKIMTRIPGNEMNPNKSFVRLSEGHLVGQNCGDVLGFCGSFNHGTHSPLLTCFPARLLFISSRSSIGASLLRNCGNALVDFQTVPCCIERHNTISYCASRKGFTGVVLLLFVFNYGFCF